jgi:hypothetical protein
MSADKHVRISGSRDSLRHLEKVGLEFEALPHALQQKGLTRQELFGALQERLQRASVQVVTRTGALHLRGAPTLIFSLEVLMSERTAGPHVYAVSLELV